MKKILQMFLVMLLCVCSVSAYAEMQDYPDNSNKVLNSLNGTWYHEDGKVAFKIDANTAMINSKKLIFADKYVWATDKPGMFRSRLILDEPLDTSSRDYYSSEKIYVMKIVANTCGITHYLKVIGEDGLLRNTPEEHYIESIGGVRLHMLQKQVEAILGAPTTVEGPKDNITATYAKQKIKLIYQYGYLVQITLEPKSKMKFDKSKLGARNPLHVYTTIYRKEFKYGVSVDIGNDEHIRVLQDGTVLFHDTHIKCEEF